MGVDQRSDPSRQKRWTTAYPMYRAVLNAIFYVTKGGIQWRMLPTNFPKWQSVYHYLRAWKRQGVWVRIHDTLRARVREKEERHKHPTAGCLDSQSVKTTEVGGRQEGLTTARKSKDANAMCSSIPWAYCS